MFDLENLVQGYNYKVQHSQLLHSIKKIPNSINIIACIFSLVEILTFQIFDLENSGQCHRLQPSQWSLDGKYQTISVI